MAAAKAEAAHNRRHYRAAMLELSEIKKDLQAKEDLVKVLQGEAQKLQYVHTFSCFSHSHTHFHSVDIESSSLSAGLRMSRSLRRSPGSSRS